MRSQRAHGMGGGFVTRRVGARVGRGIMRGFGQTAIDASVGELARRRQAGVRKGRTRKDTDDSGVHGGVERGGEIGQRVGRKWGSVGVKVVAIVREGRGGVRLFSRRACR